MFLQSATDGLRDSFFYPEWQFIQYMLPCFVTAITEMSSNPKFRPDKLQNYTRFLHSFVLNFENHLAQQNCKSPTKKKTNSEVKLAFNQWHQSQSICISQLAIYAEYGIKFLVFDPLPDVNSKNSVSSEVFSANDTLNIKHCFQAFRNSITSVLMESRLNQNLTDSSIYWYVQKWS
jgi:hypothetical protein